MTPRLRFAPSPTGYLHVGGARTALFNWLFARRHGGKFLLRIEDTDRARSTEESTRAIFQGLRWLGLDWDDEVMFQGANIAQHRRDAERVLVAGHGYRCFCTAAELDQRRTEAETRGETFTYDRRCDRLAPEDVARRVAAGDAFTVRFRVPPGETSWDDLVHGPITFPNKDIDDLIILRSDGSPIYNFAVVSDDIAMGITLVMRGDDHVSNTPKQILLYRALGAELPRFAHLPMIHGADGKKLSKRHGATAVGDYAQMGILPQAMVNFLALLGWSPGGDREIMSLADMTGLFSDEGLLKKAAVFDMAKLEWMNGQYLAQLPIEEVDRVVAPMLVAAGLTTDEELATRRLWWLTLLSLLRVRARTTLDLVAQARVYFSDTIEYEADAVAKQWKDAAAAGDILRAVAQALSQVAWEPPAMEEALRALAESRGTGAGKLFQPLRVALTGSSASPGIFDVLIALGRERSLQRIENALERLAARTNDRGGNERVP